ncbi:MAG: hypothetical protein KY476_01965 [Planctomycetes bacterium]|nr:hypothetical protein [Planctomycetota bacterium]
MRYVCSFALFLAGCGGGASQEPEVSFLPSEIQIAEATGDGAPANGGTTPTQPAGGDLQPGKIVGIVTFEGAVPNLPPLVDPAVIKPEERSICTPGATDNDRLVVNPENKGVANVFVYLDRAPRGVKVSSEPPPPVEFTNKSCQFQPHALFVRAGQTVNVTNRDPLLHNTHTLPVRNNVFNQAIGVGNTTGVPMTYSKSESLPVEVKCDFHSWMLGYHLVLDHPFGAVTDDEGRFEIPELPGGTYKFKVWHERAGYLNRSFTVKVDGDQDVTVSFAAEKFAQFDGPRPKTVYLAASGR